MEDACIRYLLNLQLPAQQLSQMMHLCGRLMLYETRKQLLQMYAHVPWAADNLSILPVLFETLLEGGSREIELCKEVLFSADCGALCELQVNSPCCLLTGDNTRRVCQHYRLQLAYVTRQLWPD